MTLFFFNLYCGCSEPTKFILFDEITTMPLGLEFAKGELEWRWTNSTTFAGKTT
jgi:hypothetical protein